MNLVLILLAWQIAPGAPERSFDDLYRAAVRLVEQGRLDEASASIEQALKQRPSHGGAWKVLGVIHASRGDAPLAEPAFRRACELAAELEDACFYHGRSLYLLNRFEESITVLRRLSSRDERAHRVIALSLEGLGKWPEAEAEFQVAIKRHRRGEDPRIDYGVALIRQGRPLDALAPLDAALRAAPESARGHLEKGRACVQLDRREAALQHLLKAVELDPRNGAGHLLLGKLYLRLGKPELADRHLRQGSDAAK